MALTVGEVETAIQSIMEGGQSVTVDGMSYSAANIKTLIELRDKLQLATDRASTRPVFRAVHVSGMGY
jgi:hypothetical protein